MGCSLPSDLHLGTLGTRTQAPPLPCEKHPIAPLNRHPLTVINASEFHTFCLWLWRQTGLGRTRCPFRSRVAGVLRVPSAPSPASCAGGGRRAPGRGRARCVCVTGSHLLFILFCFGAFLYFTYCPKLTDNCERISAPSHKK